MRNFTNFKIDEQLVSATVGSTAFDVDFSSDNIVILPGFCDVHVHFREPGFSYKETIKSGSLSAANGGYTDVCTMPNLDPVPDSVENITKQLDIIKRDALIGVHPYASITVNQDGTQLADLDGMKDLCIAYSDDGRGVQSDEMMEAAMIKAKANGKMIVAHCEVNSLLRGGYIHDGEFCRLHGMKGICSESEWRQVERDIELAKKTGCKYHVCHISAKETVELIRKAKAEGVDITCETGPHYLVLNDMDIQDHGRFKMNPPIRSEADRQALVEGILDGTIDMIATDHAPHTAEEKGRGLEKSLMGVVGLETAFAVLYTDLVKTGKAPLSLIIEKMSEAPARRFSLEGGKIEVGEKANLCVFDLENEYIINSNEFLSMGKATPFEGKKVFGRSKMTFIGGKKVWQEK